MALTEQKKRFADQYFLTLKGSESAIYAGYSENTARQIAYNLLQEPEVESYLSELKAEYALKNGINKESVLNEYRKIAFSDVRKILTIDGGLKSIDELDDDTAGAIAGIESFDEIERMTGEKLGTNRKIKLHDKLRALEALSKHLGLFERDNEQKKPENQTLPIVNIYNTAPPLASSEENV
ncbi:MAG: terminase small subunit [Bacteroidota bacterium]